MKILIVYVSKSGSTAQCAEILNSRLEGSSLCNLSCEKANIGDYDMVIAGSGVRIGKIYKPLRQFLRDNAQELKEKKRAFFLCNMEEETFQKTVEANISHELRAGAAAIESFGGKKPFSKDSGTEWIKADHMELFVKKIKEFDSGE